MSCDLSQTIPRACSSQLIFSSVQFSSVQFSSVQFSSALDNTFTLTYHYSFQFSSVQFSSIQFNSVQFSSVQFRSIQIRSIQFSSAVLCRREQAPSNLLDKIQTWRYMSVLTLRLCLVHLKFSDMNLFFLI